MIELPAGGAGGLVIPIGFSAFRAGQIGSPDSRNGAEPSVGTSAGASWCSFEHFARSGDLVLHKGITDVLFIQILVGANGLLDIGNVQDALGAIRTFFIGGDTDEENADQTEENGDDQGNFDEGKTRLLLDVIQFHYRIGYLVCFFDFRSILLLLA